MSTNVPTTSAHGAAAAARLASPQAARVADVIRRQPAVCSRPGQVIAVVGCDGSGKSTLVADLLAHVQSHTCAQGMYLGQSSGNIKRAIAHVPFVGTPLTRYLVRKASRVHATGPEGNKSLAAAVVYLLSRWRLHKFRRMISLCHRGRWVITDRYPQAEVPGFPLDGPGLAAKPAQGPLARSLARREQLLYQRMASFTPALVIRLNVDALSAHARKPDHELAMLRHKATWMPTLHFNGARILDLNATRPYAEVLATACRAADRVIEASHAAH